MPLQIGVPHEARERVVYAEHPPSKGLEELVYCTWELRTAESLVNDFIYLVLPDICTDIIFDLHPQDNENVFVMASGSDAQEINLGKTFHFMGVRFFPGTLKRDYMQRSANSNEIANTWRQLNSTKTESDRFDILLRYVALLQAQGEVAKNYLLHQVISHSQDMHTVGDIEVLTGYTRRQLQRIFREQTCLTPRDFLKVLRFQQTLHSESDTRYADQSHLTKEFKRITGLTPARFKTKY